IRGEADSGGRDGCHPKRPPISGACSADFSGEETDQTITRTQSTAATRAFNRMSRKPKHTGSHQPPGLARPARGLADGRHRSLPHRKQAHPPYPASGFAAGRVIGVVRLTRQRRFWNFFALRFIDPADRYAERRALSVKAISAWLNRRGAAVLSRSQLRCRTGGPPLPGG